MPNKIPFFNIKQQCTYVTLTKLFYELRSLNTTQFNSTQFRIEQLKSLEKIDNCFGIDVMTHCMQTTNRFYDDVDDNVLSFIQSSWS